MTLTDETKQILQRLGIAPRKRFGQHFMVDAAALTAIAEALSPKKDETVLEIGPGLGFLTRCFAEKGARVIAVEKDRNFTSFLQTYFRGKAVTVKEKDILGMDLKRDLGVLTPIKVAGNIPYNITSPILEWLIGERNCVSEACLTVQWEVAMRLVASCGSKSWGALSIFVQFYSEVELVRKIGKAHFCPPPKVDSALVKLSFGNGPRFQVQDESQFFRVVRRAFQKRRKTILNALADERETVFSKKNLSATLEKVDIRSLRRPETLSIPEWAKLADSLAGQIIKSEL